VRVLITNNTLDERAGSEMYVRDVAVALLRRGHQPVAYSSRLGAVAHELRAATVPVIDDLRQLTVVPDIIHGQHHLDAMTAMLRFPQTPAVYFCHGWLPWEELPPKFPTLQHYVAVDDLCADRLQCEHGVSADRIHLIRNFVDLRRVVLRDGLPEKPSNALVFSNSAREEGYLGVIRRACARRGIVVHAIGASVQRSEASPEQILGRHDIVFAKARSALEGMASGAAVIACDAAGMAGLVTEENYAAWRALNFGVRTLQRAITEDSVLQELDAYDAQRARAVALRTRAEADMEPAIDAIVDVYERAIADHQGASASVEARLNAASAYLRQISIEAKHRHIADRERAVAQAETATTALRAAQAEHAADELREQLAALRQPEAPAFSAAAARRHLTAVRRALVEQQQIMTAIEQEATTRAASVRRTLDTPFWQLLRRAYSARNTFGDCLAARLRLLPAQNSADELIEGMADGSFADALVESTKASTAAAASMACGLNAAFARLRIRRLVEIACGFCLWLKAAEIGLEHYTGIDIADETIEHNRRQFGGRGWIFSAGDAAAMAAVPGADAVLCRDWLEYLTNAETILVLQRIRDSGARFLIAGTHDGVASNGEGENAGWRPLNLSKAPFNLPTPIERIVLDSSSGRTLGVWRLASA
jgi:hypothetical protein